MPYPRKAMQTDRDNLPMLTVGLVLRALLLGTLLSIILLIIHGPVWTIWVAGLVVGGPYAVWEGWATNPVRKREAAAREHQDGPGSGDSSA